MTTSTLLSPKTNPRTAIIRDLIIGKQFDLVTQEACPRLRLIIDLPHESKVIKLDQTSLKNLKSVFKEKLSGWIGRKVSVYYRPQKAGVVILPVV